MGWWAVKAESPSGKVHTLKVFPSEEAANDHPVKLSNWKRAWVEPYTDKQKPDARDYAPPFPWSVLWQHGHVYVVDAEGRKIASLLGSQKRCEHIAEIIYGLNAPSDSAA